MTLGKLTELIEYKRHKTADLPITGAALDSREVKSGNIFFAAKGEKADGNVFCEEALGRGAVCVITDNEVHYEKINGNKFLVDNTLVALKSLGKEILNRTNAIKIAVTGSFGKTSTKDMLAHMLKEKYNICATKGNHNNVLGVSLTACSLNKDTDVAVFEMGSNNAGEISELSRLVRPDYALVTGVGHAHFGRFKSLEAIAKEKLSITDGMKIGAAVICHESLRRYCRTGDYNFSYYGVQPASDMRLIKHVVTGVKSHFNYADNDGGFSAAFKYPYPHLGVNFTGVALLCKVLGFTNSELENNINGFALRKGRGNILVKGDIFVIDDSYNASLESVEAAVASLEKVEICLPKYAVIGEIGEIDGFEEDIYNMVYERILHSKKIKFLLVGSSYSRFSGTESVIIIPEFASAEDIVSKITKGVILVKASYRYGFERLVREIDERVGLNAL